MVHRQTTLPGLKFFCLISIVWMLASCETSGGGGEACAGFENIISCVQIVNIAPQDSAGENSSDVDAFQSLCDPGPPAEFEVFTKHSAEITFSNDLLPTAERGSNIELTSYSLTYRLVDCPARASGCPPLSSPPVQRFNVLLPAGGGNVTATVDFVPLSVKDQYADAGGEDRIPPTYAVDYVFRGRTVPFNAAVTIEGSAEFNIANFNTCS